MKFTIQTRAKLLALGLAALAAGPAWCTDVEPQSGASQAFVSDEAETGTDADFVEHVAYDYLQPGDGMEGMAMMPRAPAQASRGPTRRGPTGSRQANIRLASVPNMLGDTFANNVGIFVDNANISVGTFSSAGLTLPFAGGSRRVKIGENNKALPDDRVYVMYHHFHNALEVQETPLAPPGPSVVRQTNVDRFTFGFEKMFLDDLWSVEVRMPFCSSFDIATQNFGVDGGSVGNLSVILKNLLYTDERHTVAAGVGLDLPTGDDVTAYLGPLDLKFENEAVHVLPYVGFLCAPDDTFFMLGFWQVDLAANGNEVRANQGQTSLGRFTEQNLMYFDLSVGAWVFRDQYAPRLTGIALLGELHYITSIQDSDRITGQLNLTDFEISNPYNRVDILNGTVAVQIDIANTSALRVAYVTPLSDEDRHRAFDSEIQVQFNRRF